VPALTSFQLSLGLSARPARASDYRTLVSLCRRSVGLDDYAIPRLKSVIKDGSLFVVVTEGKIVAMSNFTLAIDGSGWLSMARTDPNYRGQGIAQFMQNQIGDYARGKGIYTLRFWVLSTNASSLRAARKGKFNPVADFTHVSAHLRYQKSRLYHAQHGKVTEFEVQESDYISELSKSLYIKMTNGYFSYGNTIAKLGNDAWKSIPDRDLYFSKDSSFILTQPKRQYDKWQSDFTPLLGSPRVIFSRICERARSFGVEDLGGYIPFDSSIKKFANDSGFSVDPWGIHCILFEKEI
jgi:GNAT superfamily N-acetyltransferase